MSWPMKLSKKDKQERRKSKLDKVKEDTAESSSTEEVNKHKNKHATAMRKVPELLKDSSGDQEAQEKDNKETKEAKEKDSPSKDSKRRSGKKKGQKDDESGSGEKDHGPKSRKRSSTRHEKRISLESDDKDKNKDKPESKKEAKEREKNKSKEGGASTGTIPIPDKKRKFSFDLTGKKEIHKSRENSKKSDDNRDDKEKKEDHNKLKVSLGKDNHSSDNEDRKSKEKHEDHKEHKEHKDKKDKKGKATEDHVLIPVNLGKDNNTIKVFHRKKEELPENLLKQWHKLGLSDEEIETNIDLIFHVSWFIERDDFPKDFLVYERIGESPTYCTKADLEMARAVLASPPKDLKKFCKAMEFFDKGGFGAVFSGKVPVGKRKERVAIKKLPHHSERVMENNLSESKFFDVLEGVRINFCAKKLKEARVALVLLFFLSQCKHPNIVEQCYLVDPSMMKDKKLTNTEIWIVMEFLEGGTLSEAARASTFSDNHVAYVAREILKALEYMHDRNFVHRDLKSQNVMLSIKGEVKLIDFGLAADLSAGPQTKMLGSPFWIPPEMILLQPHDISADIWSFAVCILEFFLMSPPLYHSSLMCMYTAATRGLSHLIPEEATSFAKSFLQKCLVVDKTHRATTKELLKHPWVTRPNLFDGIPSVLRQIFLCHNLGSLGFV